MVKKGALIVISGPSGCGKGTIVERLLEEGNMEISISSTTRKPRGIEQNGVDYFFLEEEEFKRMIDEGEFLEYANVYGCFYGTPRKKVLDRVDAGINVILEIDVQGALQVKKNYPDAIMIFIMPPSKEELLRRLRGRGTETEEQIERRISKAQSEIDMADQYEFKVVNDDLDLAVREVKEIICNNIK